MTIATEDLAYLRQKGFSETASYIERMLDACGEMLDEFSDVGKFDKTVTSRADAWRAVIDDL